MSVVMIYAPATSQEMGTRAQPEAKWRTSQCLPCWSSNAGCTD
jgi:hypothetical protein